MISVLISVLIFLMLHLPYTYVLSAENIKTAKKYLLSCRISKDSLLKMSATIVGSEGCSITSVVTLLSQASTFHLLGDKFGHVARWLDTAGELRWRLSRQLPTGLVTFSDAIELILEEWVARAGSGATILKLITALDISGLTGCSELLRKKFLPNAITEPFSTPSSQVCKFQLDACGTGASEEPQKDRNISKYGSKELFGAIRNGDSNLVKKIVSSLSREAINERDETGKSILHHATGISPVEKSLDVIRFLADNGCDVFSKNSEGYTFLSLLLARRTLSSSQFHDFVVYLFGKGYCELFNRKREGGKENTVFQDAIHNVDVEEETLFLLHSHGVDFNAVNGNGVNCLLHAIEGGRSLKVLSSLIGFGVNVNCVGKDGWSLLHQAARHVKESQYLMDVTKLLVHNGTNINAVINTGHSALMIAVQLKRSIEYIKLLVGLGADWKVTTNSNSTVLTFAAEFNTLEVLEYFLELGGVNINGTVSNDNGNTALHIVVAAKTGKEMVERVRLLLNYGADLNARDKDGLTPYQLAKTKCHCSVTMEGLRKLMQ